MQKQLRSVRSATSFYKIILVLTLLSYYSVSIVSLQITCIPCSTRDDGMTFIHMHGIVLISTFNQIVFRKQ